MEAAERSSSARPVAGGCSERAKTCSAEVFSWAGPVVGSVMATASRAGSIHSSLMLMDTGCGSVPPGE